MSHRKRSRDAGKSSERRRQKEPHHDHDHHHHHHHHHHDDDDDDVEKLRIHARRLSQEVHEFKHVEAFYEKPPPGLIKEREDRPEDCIPEASGNEDARDFLAHAPTKGLWMPLGKEVKVMQCWRCKRYGHRTGDKECPFFIKGNQKLEQFRVAHEDPMYNLIRENKRNEKETRNCRRLSGNQITHIGNLGFSLSFVDQEGFQVTWKPSQAANRIRHQETDWVLTPPHASVVLTRRIQQLQQLLQDTTSSSSSSDSDSSSSDHRHSKKKKRKKEKKKKDKKKQKRKKKHKLPGGGDDRSDCD